MNLIATGVLEGYLMRNPIVTPFHFSSEPICYKLPLATLSCFYDNFSFHASSSHDSAYASFWHLLSHLYWSSIFLFCSSIYAMLTHLHLCPRHALFWCFLSQSQFPCSAHSPMVCAQWCWHINTRTRLPCISSLDLPRNTLIFLRSLRSLSLRPTIEWTLHNPTSIRLLAGCPRNLWNLWSYWLLIRNTWLTTCRLFRTIELY